MPADADYGRDLAEQLTALDLGSISEVVFTYDPYVDFEQLETSEPYCCISPNLYEHIRESRVIWRETIQLVVTLISVAGTTSDSDWVDGWLDDWDAAVREMRELKVLGKHKPVSVDADARYDTDLFHNHNRLVTQAMLNYQNVKVM